jgi:hypothetical protein
MNEGRASRETAGAERAKLLLTMFDIGCPLPKTLADK